jgi:hypothetical protein
MNNERINKTGRTIPPPVLMLDIGLCYPRCTFGSRRSYSALALTVFVCSLRSNHGLS